MAYAAYRTYLNNPNKSFAYMDVKQGDKQAERVVFELESSICPRTTENFLTLCTGEKGEVDGVKMSYVGTPFHRVAADGWVQGGGK